MKKFTFLTLSYNHERTIEEHLESIKSIVIQFGKNININYILCDDCSKDGTIRVATKWLKENPIFDFVSINRNEKNIGTVKNLIQALSLVETESFKLLAGDDAYGLFDIFDVLEKLDKSILVTPVTPFGSNSKDHKGYEYRYRLLMYMDKHRKLTALQSISNLIPAPGVFFKRSLVQDEKFFHFLSQFKYIEDYPMWHYLLNVKKINAIVNNRSYIYYRIGSGITSGGVISKQLKDEHLKDLERINKIIKPKRGVLPKYINPYMYYLGIMCFKANLQKEKLPIYYLSPKQ